MSRSSSRDEQLKEMGDLGNSLQGMGNATRWKQAISAALLVLLGVCLLPKGAAATSCPNEAARIGPSSELPDCRAYELVTPPTSDGRLLEVLGLPSFGQLWDMFPVELGSPIRDSFAFLTYAGGLSEPGGGSGAFDVYRSEREEAGWSTKERISRTASNLDWTLPGGLSSDHAFSFTNEHLVDYLRKPDGSFELTGRGSLADEPYAEGRYISPGGDHVIFATGHDQLMQSAWCAQAPSCKVARVDSKSPPEGTGAIYDRPASGLAHVVSLLPNDVIPEAGEQACYLGASRDASSVAFRITAPSTECNNKNPASSTLYVRIHNGEPGAEKTLEVAEGSASFAGVSDNGRYLFYVLNGIIHRFDTEANTDVVVTSGGEGEIVNSSPDGTHVYFISDQQLDGEKGTAGQPNLYVWESSGAPEYVATVLPSDLIRTSGEESGFPALTTWTELVANRQLGNSQGPGADSSRTTPNGEFLVVESKAKLTGYQNNGITEIYRWDDESKEMLCISCNFGQPAEGDARLQELHLVGPQVVVHNVSNDGSRVFFETPEALSGRDTDGINDIYEWRKEGGQTTVSLITSGRSQEYPLEGQSPGGKFAPLANLLLSVAPDGSDVFFMAKEALVPGAGENGTEAIYDARINGGFVSPPTVKECAEEACKPLPQVLSTLSFSSRSEEIVSSGNVRPHRRPCPRHQKNRTKGRKQRLCAKGHRSGNRARSSTVSSPIGAAEVAGGSAAPAADTQQLSTSSSGDGALVAESSSPVEFGIEKLVAEVDPASAGSHPDFSTTLVFDHFESAGKVEASAAAETVSVKLPPGLLGNSSATPTCSMGGFVAYGRCSPASQVGITTVTVGKPLNGAATEPVYNLTPPHPDREVARLGFIAFLYPVFIDVKVRTATDYGVTATIHDAAGYGPVIRAKTILWGDPSGSEHDKQRFTPYEAANCPPGTACKQPEGKVPSGVPLAEHKAFMTNPSSCQDGRVDAEATSYQLPGQIFTASAPLSPITDCTGLPFAPSFEADPTSHVAGAPTGLKTKLTIPQHLGPEERATATMREARVTLPAGMQVAAGAANWIGTCSEEQVGYHEEVDTACPDASKLGTATIKSPDLPEPIEGTIYQRSPEPGHQLGLWLTSDALGLHIKLPGSLEPDPQTGRLTAVFRDLPQVPVEEIDLNVWGGPRAPLQNPDHCGTFTTDFSFSPHSNDSAATGQSTMQITEGCNQSFDPTLHAGVTEPVAGRYSPFVFDLTRADGDQALRGFELKLPDGELAKIKGVPLCPDAQAAAASCPVGSRIGSLQATTGPGPEPFTIPAPGKAQPQIYLAGPYQGSPFSIFTEVPAQAGPFDLGTLAVRSGLTVEPETGRAVVKADPLPQFFEGVGIAYRNLHAVVDRPEFDLNPTDCREMAVNSDVTSTQGTVAHPSARFQVDGCKALKFKPKLSLMLKGGTKRAQYPALTAVLKARKGDANIAFTSVALPHSEFLAQEHIGTICTRVQFAADKCPKGSVYGRAKAITPLLGKPLSGNVYLRSSNHPLPDLVAKLGGELEIDLVGRIDSVHGGIRTTFESVPDAPVSRFVLQMRGGAKGLLTNSTDICRGSHRATVAMRAQNGRRADLRPVLQSSGCGHNKLGNHKHHH